MKRKILTIGLLLCFFTVCLAAIADMSGKWSAVFNAPDGNQYPLTYTLKIDANKLTGTLETAGMTIPIDNGVVNGDSVKFSLTVQDITYAHKGKYFSSADSISMDVAFEGNKAHTTLTRPK
jgi:hypothetical protein